MKKHNEKASDTVLDRPITSSAAYFIKAINK